MPHTGVLFYDRGKLVEEEQMKVKVCIILVFSAWLLGACISQGFGDGEGSVLMKPYTNPELGFESVVPMHGYEANPGSFVSGSSLREYSILVIQNLPDTDMEGAIEELKQVSPVKTISETERVYRNQNLEWYIQTIELMEGLITLKGKLAMAEGETSVYLIFSGSILNNYDRQPEIYDTAFYHALHAFTPIPNDDRSEQLIEGGD